MTPPPPQDPVDGAAVVAQTVPDTLLPDKGRALSIRVIGVGGAGGNAVAHMANTDLRDLRLAVLHTSSRILDITQAPEKVLIGKDLTFGLGAGGDPSLARAAAEQDLALLKNLCEGVDLIFLVTGLGGGTGTGVAPVMARVAKESGALVLAVATLPFDLEGGRRKRQAEQGLTELKAAADAVICLAEPEGLSNCGREHQRAGEPQDHQRTARTRHPRDLAHAHPAEPDPCRFCRLAAVLRDRHVASAFASVEAKGEGRAREVMDQLLASPLLDGGHLLNEAEAVLIHLVGGSDMTMADVKRVMEEINRRVDNAQLIMGATVSDGMEGRMGLTLVASCRSSPTLHPRHTPLRYTPKAPAAAERPGSEPDNKFLEISEDEAASSRFVPPPPQITLDALQQFQRGANGMTKRGKAALRRLQQGNLPLDIVSKGRFEKSQPTIHRGEDLDVPTYVRRGIPLN